MAEAFTTDDLRSAVAAGLLTEAQAADLMVHVAARAGKRAALTGEDEPFELFRGFAEIFISVGLILLMSGILTVASLFGGFLTPLFAAGLCWSLALYFTRKRRMMLPSIVLVSVFAISAVAAALLATGTTLDRLEQGRVVLAISGLLVLAALAAWYRVFKVPFTMFLAGLVALGLVFLVTDSIVPLENGGGWSNAFDLRQGSGLAVGTLAFGVLALMAGLFFDMRDPWRLGRWSASGFWLHILAAPALVNTIALTAYNVGGVAGNLLLALCLVLIAAFALIIDRRSFLTAGIGYLGILVAWALRVENESLSVALLLMVLGGFLTAMGTWWTDLRCWLMQRLPEFPGKNRLPPYARLQ